MPRLTLVDPYEIIGLGDDIDSRSIINTGSVLIKDITVGGAN